MRQSGALLHRTAVDETDVRITWPLFRRALDDLESAAGPLVPGANWLTLTPMPSGSAIGPALDAARSEAGFVGAHDSLDRVLHHFIGSRQSMPVGLPPTDRYAALLQRWDPLGLWRHNVESSEIAARLRIADLGTIFDLNLLYSARPAAAATTIVEVGGGYGRLAEAAVSVFGDSIRYVLVDSVPLSLCYAAAYLRKACPEVSIGSYYDGEPFDLTRFQVYVVPSWHFRSLSSLDYQILVGINSFQEMSQAHVDWYLQLFDEVAASGAVCYLNNAHDYIFTGEWRIPARWRRLLTIRSPRSWSVDHPTELFEITDGGDHTMVNAAATALYQWGLGENANGPWPELASLGRPDHG